MSPRYVCIRLDKLGTSLCAISNCPLRIKAVLIVLSLYAQEVAIRSLETVDKMAFLLWFCSLRVMVLVPLEPSSSLSLEFMKLKTELLEGCWFLVLFVILFVSLNITPVSAACSTAVLEAECLQQVIFNFFFQFPCYFQK